jgi:hypothetical protein
MADALAVALIPRLPTPPPPPDCPPVVTCDPPVQCPAPVVCNDRCVNSTGLDALEATVLKALQAERVYYKAQADICSEGKTALKAGQDAASAERRKVTKALQDLASLLEVLRAEVELLQTDVGLLKVLSSAVNISREQGSTLNESEIEDIRLVLKMLTTTSACEKRLHEQMNIIRKLSCFLLTFANISILLCPDRV